MISYDRAGFGKSEPGWKPRTAEQIVSELHKALKKAKLKPPYVLVGHSAGGMYMRVFAHKYPQEVSGIVLVDPAPEAFYGWLKVKDQWAALNISVQQAKAAWPLPRVPLVLLTAMRPGPEPPAEGLQVWLRMHKEFLRRVPGSKHVVTEKSGHDLPHDQPELVIDTIKQIVERVKR